MPTYLLRRFRRLRPGRAACWALLAGTLAAAASPLAARAAEEGALTGRAIMEKVEDSNRPKDERVTVRMLLVDERGRERERIVTVYTLSDPSRKDKTLLEFVKPTDVRGTRFLTHEHLDQDDDRWMYIPAMRKVRRITAADDTDYFMGTDATFEDMRSESLDAQDYKLLREEVKDGRDCWLIEAQPATEDEKKNSGYSKRHLWVDKESLLVVHRQYWNKKGEHTKDTAYSGFEKLADGLWVYNKIDVDNHGRDHRTVFEYSERTIDSGLDENLFSQRSLLSGR